MCCCFEFLFTVNRCATHKSPTWTEPQQSQRGGNKSCLSCTERGECGEYRQGKAKLAVWWLCLRQQLKVQSYRICVCLPGTHLAPDPASPGVASASGQRNSNCSPPGRQVNWWREGGWTLGTNSLRFSCSIAANKPAASPALPIFSSNSNSSSNQRLVNNYPCTSKLQTHEIEIRHRHRRRDRETERQRQRPLKQLKMKTRKGSWKKSDGTANLWCPTGSPSSW